MIYNTEKKHTRFMLCELIYVSFSLFDSNANVQNIFFGKVYQKLFFMNNGLWIYTLLNKYTVLEITAVYKLTNSKNKKNKLLLLLFRQESSVYTCLKPNLITNPWTYKLYSLSFFMWDSKILTTSMSCSNGHIKN